MPRRAAPWRGVPEREMGPLPLPGALPGARPSAMSTAMATSTLSAGTSPIFSKISTLSSCACSMRSCSASSVE